MKVLIDAGHGGKDPGAINKATGRQEKDITIEVAFGLATLLNKMKHTVLLTRSTDTYLSPSERLAQIKLFKPDCFISIHCNASVNPQATGVETIYRDEYDLPLAQSVHNALIEHTGLKDRGVKRDIEHLKRRLTVLEDLKTPAILIEIGFISNIEDLKVIEDEKLIAKAIAEGVDKWGLKT